MSTLIQYLVLESETLKSIFSSNNKFNTRALFIISARKKIDNINFKIIFLLEFVEEQICIRKKKKLQCIYNLLLKRLKLLFLHLKSDSVLVQLVKN